MRLSITRIYYWLARQIERFFWQQDNLINKFDQIVVFESTTQIATWLENYRIVAFVVDHAGIEIGRCKRSFPMLACHASRLIEVNEIHIDRDYCRMELQRGQRVTNWLRLLLNAWKKIWSQWTRRKARHMYPKAVLHSKSYSFPSTPQSPSIADPKHSSHLRRQVLAQLPSTGVSYSIDILCSIISIASLAHVHIRSNTSVAAA